MVLQLHKLSWPARADHPVDDELDPRIDAHLPDGPGKSGHDKGRE